MEDNKIHESVVEESIISLLQDQGYEFVDTATGSSSYWLVNRQLDEFLNEELLRECLQRINPKLPPDDLE